MLRAFFLLAFFLFSFALASSAQSSAAASSSSQQESKPARAQQSPATNQKPTKKVWTNDDVPALREKSVSIVGNPAPAEKSNASQRPAPGSQQAAPYRESLRKLRAELAALDKQISNLRNFNGDNSSPSGGLKMNGRYSTVQFDEQLKRLEAKRKQLQEKIEAIEDEARHKGIAPGDLR